MTEHTPEEALERANAEQQALAAVAKTGRSCGNCSLCCKLPPIDEEPIVKVEGVWCRHIGKGGQGCSIYDQRPSLCRAFVCAYLVWPHLSEEWHPRRAKFYIALAKSDGVPTWEIYSDPHSFRWREEPYISTLRQLARESLSPSAFRWVRLFQGKREFLFLPGVELETGPADLFVRTDTDIFVIAPISSDPTEAKRDAAAFNAAWDKGQQIGDLRDRFVLKYGDRSAWEHT